MTQTEIIEILESTEIPVFYDHAPIGTRLPFIAVHITQPDNFSADNQVYVENFHFRVDLYTAQKDVSLENLVKKALNDHNIYWTRTETFIDSDDDYEIEFEFDELGVDRDGE